MFMEQMKKLMLSFIMLFCPMAILAQEMMPDSVYICTGKFDGRGDFVYVSNKTVEGLSLSLVIGSHIQYFGIKGRNGVPDMHKLKVIEFGQDLWFLYLSHNGKNLIVYIALSNEAYQAAKPIVRSRFAVMYLVTGF